jgi:PAS domain S-box-containing protein
LVVAKENPLRVELAGTCSPAFRDELRKVAEQACLVLAGHEASPAEKPSCILLFADSDDWKSEIVRLRKASRELPCAVVLVCRPEAAPDMPTVFRHGARDVITTDQLNATSLKRTVERAVLSCTAEQQSRHISARNSELAAVVYASPDAIMSADAEDRVRSWNPGAAALFGYSEDEALGQTIGELIIPDQLRLERNQLYAHVLAGRSVTGLETERRRKDGSLIAVEVNCSPMYDDDGEVTGFTVIFRDISARKRAEDALRLSEEKYARAFAGNPAAITLTRLKDATFIEVNDTWVMASGYSRDDAIGKTASAIQMWNDASEWRQFVDELSDKGFVNNWERAFKRKSGEIFFAQLSAQILKLQGEDVILSSFVDITERKRAEAALGDSEAFSRSVLEASPDSIEILTATGEVTYMNANSLKAAGFDDISKVAGRRYTSIWPESLRPRVEAAIAKASAGGTDRFEGFCQTGGPFRYWDVAISPVRNYRNEIRHLIVSSRDITDRRRVENALRDNEQRLRLATDAVGLGVITIDYATKTARPDAIAAGLYGFEAHKTISLADLHACIHPEDSETVHRSIVASLDPESPGTLSLEHRILRRDGVLRWLSVKKQVNFIGSNGSRRPESALLMAFDITERKAAEEEIFTLNKRLSQRIERTERNFTTYFDLIQNNPFGVLLVDSNLRLTQLSQGAHKVFSGIEPLLGRDVTEIIHLTWSEPYSCGIIKRIRQTLDTGDSHTSTETMRLRSDAETVQSYDWRIERVTLSDGLHGVVCHFYDMTERQRYEDKIRLLMREVNHRSKNIMMLVQAVARQTAARGTEDFLTRFDQRLQALSTSQDLLVRGEWKSVNLAELVHSQLAHFEDLVGSRITIGETALELKVQAVQPVGMAIHELATNAGKYGALSNETGRVELNWHVEQRPGSEPVFRMSWREFGGPAVQQPPRHGFGSTVLDRMVRMSLGGSVTMGFGEEGFSWQLECPVGHILETYNTFLPAAPLRVSVDNPAGGSRILVVEDEALVAIEVAGLLEEAGWSVVGPVASVSRAMALIHQQGCDCAVLDVNLGPETSEPIAAELEHRGIPFIMVSGYARQQIPRRLSAAPFLSKPIRPKALVSEVRRCLDNVAVH